MRPASLGAQVLLLTQKFGEFERQFLDFRGEIHTWMQDRQSSWRGVWPVMVTVGGVLWFVLNLQISSSTRLVDDKSNRALTIAEQNTLQIAKIAEMMPTIVQQNATSIQDRSDQGKALGRLQEAQTQILEDAARHNAEREANEREVETQIDAMNQSLSVQFANQQRMNADFQNALHEAGAKYPAAPGGPYYFPNISNRNHRNK